MFNPFVAGIQWQLVWRYALALQSAAPWQDGPTGRARLAQLTNISLQLPHSNPSSPGRGQSLPAAVYRWLIALTSSRGRAPGQQQQQGP